MDQITTKFITSQPLPLVVEPGSQGTDLPRFLKLLRERNAEFRRDLLKYGGILFRNFPVNGVDDFAAVIEHLGLGKTLDYIGGDSPRTKIKGGVYTSTEAPPSIKIPLHNELSFVNHYPKHIYFHCAIAPEKDGETILADARKVYQTVDRDVKESFMQHGLKYVSCYFYKSRVMDVVNSFQKSHKSWIDVFETENKQEVERKCRECNFDFEWTRNDWIRISQKRPATMAHPETKEMVWFNQAHLFDFNPKLLGWWRYLAAKAFYAQKHMRLHEVYYKTGNEIPRDHLYHVLDVLDTNTVKFPWQKGDVLVLDNVLAMHGRSTFTGKRRVLAAMTG